jgi:hypothetical protein
MPPIFIDIGGKSVWLVVFSELFHPIKREIALLEPIFAAQTDDQG